MEHRIFSPKTFGQKASDFFTKWIGSWSFIIAFIIFLIIWIVANIYALTQQWDPYPFMLLNLILGCLASIQAPIILMSQNRQEQKDRARLKYDYEINKKAEREIREIKKQLERIENKLSKRN